MTDAIVAAPTRDIIVEEVLPHGPAAIWRALTTGALIERWLMSPTGFEAVEGCEFTFQTKPAGAWDGVIRCRVLEVKLLERFVISWKGGEEGNAGYGSRLDTTVTFTLEPAAEGTRLRLVHAGFDLPRNAYAFENLTEGWVSRPAAIAAVAADID